MQAIETAYEGKHMSGLTQRDFKIVIENYKYVQLMKENLD